MCLLLCEFQWIFINRQIQPMTVTVFLVPSVFCLFKVWRGGISGIQCGTCVRAQLKPDISQPPTPSLCVWRPRPCCCSLGQPSGLHTGKAELHLQCVFVYFTISFLQVSPVSAENCIKLKSKVQTIPLQC